MRAKFFLVILMAGMASISVFARIGSDEVLGAWKYKISDVPPEYQNGLLQFEKQDDKVIGFIGNGGEYKLRIKNLTTTDDKVSFKFDFDGREIIVNLKKEGEKMAGKLKTTDAEYVIQAEKVVKK